MVTLIGVALNLSQRTVRARVSESVVLTVAGRLDVETAPTLRERFIDLLAAGQRHLILDLNGVRFLDATGLGVLVGGLTRTRQAGGSLRLVCTQQSVLDVFRVTGLDRAFSIEPTVEEAGAAVL